MNTENQSSGGCAEVLNESLENALSDYEEAAEVTSEGKYRCRDCGLLFDTLEAHDRHHRQVHRQPPLHSLSNMPT